jgi:hypothetical protein
VLALSLLQPVSEKPSGWLYTALAAHVVAQTLDVSTTAWGIGSGKVREANPLMRWAAGDPVLLGLVKGGFAVASTIALLKIHKKHPRAAMVVAIGITALTGYIAYRNAQTLRSVR